jgi:hypothetical protein
MKREIEVQHSPAVRLHDVSCVLIKIPFRIKPSWKSFDREFEGFLNNQRSIFDGKSIAAEAWKAVNPNKSISHRIILIIFI